MKLFSTLTMLVLFTSTLLAQDLRTQLETSYNLFGSAVNAKDQTKLKNAMSSYSYLIAKNEAISGQVKFPDEFYNSAPRMIFDLKKETFIKAVENGPTANSIYLGKDAFGSQTLIVIHFLKEDDTWKFSSVQSNGAIDILNKLKAKDSTFLNDKDFYPDGSMPVTPNEITSVDYKGMLDVMGPGYNVQIKLNDIDQPGTLGNGFNSDQGYQNVLVLGGVKKGVNKIEITVTPIKGKVQKTLLMNVAVVLGENELEVFSIEDANPATIITKEFTVK
jgi:hypothetical protein